MQFLGKLREEGRIFIKFDNFAEGEGIPSFTFTFCIPFAVGRYINEQNLSYLFLSRKLFSVFFNKLEH